MPETQEKKYAGLAIIAFVLSVLFFIPLLPLAGVVVGIFGLVRISKNAALKGKGLAIAAIVIGALFTLLQVAIVVAVYALYSLIGSNMAIALQEDAPAGINQCIAQKKNFEKDMCIIMILSTHPQATDTLDKNLCTAHIGNKEVLPYCQALLTKDPSYCDQIELPSSQLQCRQSLIDSMGSMNASDNGNASDSGVQSGDI